MSKSKQRIIIADDHSLYRTGLKALVSELAYIEVIAEAKDGSELLELTRTLHPDMLLMDYDMPNMSGLDVLARLKQEGNFTSLKIVVITASSTEAILAEFVALGVNAIVPKTDDVSDMIAAVEAVASGENYIPDEIMTKVDRNRALRGLTSRERQVLRLVAKGLSNKGISGVMGIATKTVDGHRTSLMRKLNFHSASEVIAFAHKSGLS